jgi:hypothetical protein
MSENSKKVFTWPGWISAALLSIALLISAGFPRTNHPVNTSPAVVAPTR